MKKRSFLTTILVSILLVACRSDDAPAPELDSQAPLEEPAAEVEDIRSDDAPAATELDSQAAQEEPAAEVEDSGDSQPITSIVVDGDPDDWTDRAFFFEDSIGDAQDGFLDIESGYVLVNQDALYFLVMPVDPTATFSQFDIVFRAGDRIMMYSVASGGNQGHLSQEEPTIEDIGMDQNSTFAYRTAFEGRIALDDFAPLDEMELIAVNVMANDPAEGTWLGVDTWEPDYTPVVWDSNFDTVEDGGIDDNAMGPFANLQDAETDPIQLAEGYSAELIFVPALPDVDEIVRSENGTVYVHQGGILPGISTVDPDTGEIKRVYDFVTDFPGAIVGGPGDSAFITIPETILQIFPDGSQERWGDLGPGWPKCYTYDGQMLAVSHDLTSVIELLPDGTSVVIASGFSRIDDLVMNSDGILFVSDFDIGELVRIDLDGTRRALLTGITYHDYSLVGLDQEEKLFIANPVIGIGEVDIDNGEFAMINPPMFPGDFVFTAPGELLVVRYTEILKGDLNNTTQILLVEGRGIYTHAAAVGPDNQLYLGTTGSEDAPGQVVRFGNDGSEEILVDGLSPNLIDISFGESGDLYIAANLDGIDRVYFYPQEGGNVKQIIDNIGIISSIAADPSRNSLWIAGPEGELHEYSAEGLVTAYEIELPEPVLNFRIDIAPDGTLYASASEAARMITGPVVKRWILRLEPLLGKSEIIAQYDRDGSGTFDFMGVDPLGNIWWITNPDTDLLKVTPDGLMELIASNLPMDSPAVIANSYGDVYIPTSSGIYRIFRVP